MNQYKKNSSAPEDFELLSRKETYTIWQKLIKDYFSSVHDKNGFVFNLKDMKDSIEKHNDVPTISDATFYRYTKKCIFRNMSIHIMANTIMKLTNLLMIWKKLY